MKFRWGKYLGFASNDPPFTSTNPAATLVATASRAAGPTTISDRVVDCDLLNNGGAEPDGGTGSVDTCPAATGNSANFGKIGAATIVDPAAPQAAGACVTHDYQTEITLQQEVLPRVSAEVSYIHRTFHGLLRDADTWADDAETGLV